MFNELTEVHQGLIKYFIKFLVVSFVVPFFCIILFCFTLQIHKYNKKKNDINKKC